MDYSKFIAGVQDFPIKGILFRDITPLLQDAVAFKSACHEIAEYAKSKGAEVICGPESRGFIFGCPVATELGLGFVPIRKPGKLPRETVEESYALEYGTNTLSMHKDAIKPGQKVVIVDDLLATGGTMNAAIKMIERLGGQVVGLAFLIELTDLEARNNLLKGQDIFTLIEFKEFE